MKKIGKQLFALLLCLVMCLSLLPTAAFAEEEAPQPEPEAAAQAEPAEEAAAEEEAAEEAPAGEAGEETAEEPAAEESAAEPAAEEPSDREETLAEPAAEESAEKEPAAAAEEEIITVEPVIESAMPSSRDRDNEELLEGFAQAALTAPLSSGRPGMLKAPKNVGARLTGVTRGLYLNVRPQIAQVADGQQTSTIFVIPVADLGLEQTRWTAEELGLDKLVDEDTGNFTDQALDAVYEIMDYDFPLLLDALLADCPYELYWYDKTVSSWISGFTISGTRSYIEVRGSFKISMPVVREYAGAEEYTVDSTIGSSIRQAVEQAQSIVSANAGSGDYDRMWAYADAICALTEYNWDAASESYVAENGYGNPWQLIWIFDGDASTNVVCEGYSKAFQYLCDLSDFYGTVTCCSVTGSIGGAHMWNIVTMEDGKNYVVDVTNSDGGGSCNGKYFLRGAASGSVTGGYQVNNGSGTLRYSYDSDTLSLFSAAELTLAGSDYDPATAYVPVTGLSLTPASLSLGEGETGRLSASVQPANASNQAVSYSSSDSGVASVNNSGTVTGRSVGTAVITAVSADSGVSASCTVTVSHIPGQPVRENEVPATCTAEGSYEEAVYCSVCGEELSREQKVIGKLPHTHGQPVRENEAPATCTAEGSYDEVVSCSVCGEELSREHKTIEKLPHQTEVRGAMVPTCTEEGYTGDEICTVCGQTVKAGHSVAKLPHSPGQAVRENEIPATYDAEGSYEEVISCTVCGQEISRTEKVLPKLFFDTPVLQSAACADGGVLVKWQAVSGAEGYRVYRKTTGSWGRIADVTENEFLDTTAVSNTKYTYTVRAMRGSELSGFDAAGKSVLYIAAPVLKSAVGTATGVKITWAKSEGAARYRVFRRTADSSWTKVGDTTALTLTDTKAVSGTEYIYTVRCLSSDSKRFTSAFDAEGLTVTFIATPALPVLVATTEGVHVTWTAVDGAEQYRVFRKLSGGSWARVEDTTGTSIEDKTVESGKTYVYTVRCMNGAGTAYTSAYNTSGKSIAYIAAPELKSAVNTAAGVKITWAKSEGAAKYRVFRKVPGGSWAKVGDTTALTITDTKAVSGTEYIYTVRCLSSDGKKYTSAFDAEGLTVTFIAAPALKSIQGLNEGVKITWAGSAGAEKYRIFRKEGSSGWSVLEDVDGSVTAYTDGSVTAGRKYTYTVRCVTADGSAYTSAYNATGLSLTYAASPVLKSVARSNGAAVLRWAKAAGAQKYRVFRKTSAAGSWAKLADTTALSYTDATAKTGYIYTVRCISSDAKLYTSGFDSAGLTYQNRVGLTITSAKSYKSGFDWTFCGETTHFAEAIHLDFATSEQVDFAFSDEGYNMGWCVEYLGSGAWEPYGKACHIVVSGCSPDGEFIQEMGKTKGEAARGQYRITLRLLYKGTEVSSDSVTVTW